MDRFITAKSQNYIDDIITGYREIEYRPTKWICFRAAEQRYSAGYSSEAVWHQPQETSSSGSALGVVKTYS